MQSAASIAPPARLLQMSNAVVVQQALYAVAKLGVADLLDAVRAKYRSWRRVSMQTRGRCCG